ncbi:hypothetical protein BH23CHL7_BH23CHL7_06210 [soil metagenome]
MIVRQVRCVVAEQDLPAFLEHARQVVQRHAGNVDGLLALELGINHPDGKDVTVLAQSHWRDFAAMQAYLGTNLYRPALWDADERWLKAAIVEHYEVVARDESETA